MTIPNHDHEIEKRVHPENFEESTIEMQTFCARCGEEKGEHIPGACSAWGDFWKRHFFVTSEVEVINIKIT